MTTILTRYSDNASTTPTLILPWSATVEFGTVVHDIPGRADGTPDVTLRPGRSRAGEMRLFYADAVDAHAALELHAAASVFLVSSDDVDWLPTVYVATGTGRLEQDARAVLRWTATIPWREVTL